MYSFVFLISTMMKFWLTVRAVAAPAPHRHLSLIELLGLVERTPTSPDASCSWDTTNKYFSCTEAKARDGSHSGVWRCTAGWLLKHFYSHFFVFQKCQQEFNFTNFSANKRSLEIPLVVPTFARFGIYRNLIYSIKFSRFIFYSTNWSLNVVGVGFLVGFISAYKSFIKLWES